MPSPLPFDAAAVHTPRRLNGWKEIAAYLDRGVRTVQRWEKDFGMPVHRLGPGKGEGVVAFAHELDAWQTTPLGNRAREAGADGVAEPPLASQAPPDTDPLFDRVWFIRMSVAALVTAVTVVVLWAAGVYWQVIRYGPPGDRSVPGPAPAAWRIDLDTLIVSDAMGILLWRHRFPFPLDSAAYESPRLLGRLPVGIEDLDGDGRREVWCVSSPERGTDWPNYQLFLFNSDGSIRWTYQFAGDVVFGSQAFVPPWPVRGVFLTDDPDGTRRRALWVTSIDRMLFPSVLQRLDLTTGAPLGTYWSNGYILGLSLLSIDGRPTLFVGASNNERKAGSLAVLDARNPNGSAPAEKGAYRCTSCPPGQPETFLVFQKPRRFGKPDDTTPVFRIERAGNGGVHVNVMHAVTSTGLHASAVYTLDGSYRPTSVSTADGYAATLRALASDGGLPPGGLSPVDPDREFLPIWRWDKASQRFVAVPKAPSTR
jgi:hypothetical protein